jgi:hypothetical protein
MNQTLHIFSKDARRFWPEIVISLALLAAFACVLHPAAQAHRFGTDVLYSLLQPILYVLIPISWWVLVSRVVHEENLVGDRQFWITRPYQWPSLLAAKLLFLTVFMLVPIGIMQAVVLSVAGFHPIHLIPGILFSIALLGATVILPLAALSTVTSSFARLTVTMLGIFIGVLIVGSLLIPRARNFGVTPHPEWPYLFITFAAAAGIVLLQYARRRTLIARILLGSSIVLLILLPVFFSTSLMPLYFHSSGASSLPKVALDRSQTPWVSGTIMNNSEEIETVNVPVVISGVPPDSISAIEAVKATLTTASGLKYSGPWRSLNKSPHQDGGSDTIPVSIPKSFFDKAKTSPVTMSLSLGVTELTAQGTFSTAFPTGKTEIPGIGLCSAQSNALINNQNSSFYLTCTAPLRNPDYTYATARWSDIPCNRPQPPVEQLVPGDIYIGNFDSDPAGMGLSPLVDQQINFSNGVVVLPNNASRQRYLCAGTPLTFTRYLLTRRFETRLSVPEINTGALPSSPFGDHSLQLSNPAADPEE